MAMFLGWSSTRRRLVINIALLWIMQAQAFQPLVVSRQQLQQRRSSHLGVASMITRNETCVTTMADIDVLSVPSTAPYFFSDCEEPEPSPPLPMPTESVPSENASAGSSSSSIRSSNMVTEIASPADLVTFMVGSQSDDELTVIKYYAHYCKICQRAGIQLKKIASEFPDVRFGKVESMVFPDSAQTLRTLGVSKFPFVQIYRRGQCVASFSTGPSHLFVKKVRDTIEDCRKRSPEEWDGFVTRFSNEIESNLCARENLAKL